MQNNQLLTIILVELTDTILHTFRLFIHMYLMGLHAVNDVVESILVIFHKVQLVMESYLESHMGVGCRQLPQEMARNECKKIVPWDKHLVGLVA